MTTRKHALAHLRIALLQNDMSTALRIYTENRISAKVFHEYREKYWRKPGRVAGIDKAAQAKSEGDPNQPMRESH